MHHPHLPPRNRPAVCVKRGRGEVRLSTLILAGWEEGKGAKLEPNRKQVTWLQTGGGCSRPFTSSASQTLFQSFLVSSFLPSSLSRSLFFAVNDT